MPSGGSPLAGQEGVVSDMDPCRSPDVSGQLKQSISMGLVEGAHDQAGVASEQQGAQRGHGNTEPTGVTGRLASERAERGEEWLQRRTGTLPTYKETKS